MQKRQFLINSIMSVLQVITTGGVLFVLYRFLLNTIGVERLGIWSVVVAITSLANIGDFGLASSGVKFVAKYLARGEEDKVLGVIQTLAISICVLVGLVLLIVYPLSVWLLGIIVPSSSLGEALSILPYVLISLWITLISTVYQTGLDGYQRIDIRSMLLIFGTLLHLVLCLFLVPAYGLIGLAYSRIIQASILLFGSWVLLRKFIPMLPVIGSQWNYKLFREMVGYGSNIQLINICYMLFDPVTKAFITRFGGLSMTAFYEMANRMILQLRAIVINTNQVFVPAIAELQEKNPEMIRDIYRQMYRFLVYMSLPLFSSLIAFTPVISLVWIGHYESTFVFFSIVLAIGIFISTILGAAYYTNLGIGELRWNVIGHVIIAIFNPTLGFVIGSIYGGRSVAVAWVLSLVIGSFITPIAYHHRYDISIKELLPKESIVIGLACLAGLCTSLLFYEVQNSNLDLLLLSTFIVLLYFAITALPIWRHPMRKLIQRWIANEFFELKKG